MENNMKTALDQLYLFDVYTPLGYIHKNSPSRTCFFKADYNYSLFLKHRLFIYNKLDELNNININNIISSKLGDDITSVIFKYSGKYKTKRDKLPLKPIWSGC